MVLFHYMDSEDGFFTVPEKIMDYYYLIWYYAAREIDWTLRLSILSNLIFLVDKL